MVQPIQVDLMINRIKYWAAIKNKERAFPVIWHHQDAISDFHQGRVSRESSESQTEGCNTGY